MSDHHNIRTDTKTGAAVAPRVARIFELEKELLKSNPAVVTDAGNGDFDGD
jgi:hypothetical protein